MQDPQDLPVLKELLALLDQQDLKELLEELDLLDRLDPPVLPDLHLYMQTLLVHN